MSNHCAAKHNLDRKYIKNKDLRILDRRKLVSGSRQSASLTDDEQGKPLSLYSLVSPANFSSRSTASSNQVG
jgi:hypothetical protein